MSIGLLSLPVRSVAPRVPALPLDMLALRRRNSDQRKKRASRCLTRRLKTRTEDLRMFRQLKNHLRSFLAAAIAAASLLGAGSAEAAFPERPITLIVPWA